jgi:hypothetical protein
MVSWNLTFVHHKYWFYTRLRHWHKQPFLVVPRSKQRGNVPRMSDEGNTRTKLNCQPQNQSRAACIVCTRVARRPPCPFQSVINELKASGKGGFEGTLPPIGMKGCSSIKEELKMREERRALPSRNERVTVYLGKEEGVLKIPDSYR